MVEFAPLQAVPRGPKKKQDARKGTIEQGIASEKWGGIGGKGRARVRRMSCAGSLF